MKDRAIQLFMEGMLRYLPSLCLYTFVLTNPVTAAETIIRPREKDGTIEAMIHDMTAFAWRLLPLDEPKGGLKFASSGFIQSFSTPSGFQMNSIQPADHMHHLGSWWPWKFIEVDGRKYNTWEIQEGQGAHVAKTATLVKRSDNSLTWHLKNQTVIKQTGAPAIPVIDESTTLTFRRQDQSRHILDIEIRQQAIQSPVTISSYRYSGFSWRGTSAWHKENSHMLTSSGKHSDNANGTPARWVLVTGDTPRGKASMVILSAAIKIASIEENLRVWNTGTENGTPFINLNPVMSKPIDLKPENKAVSHRKYRLIAADIAYDAAAAEAAWLEWMNE